jgi:DNA-binding response OmpR family regulator
VKKIFLLVDDDDGLSKLMKLCIEESGEQIRIVQASSAENAIQYLNNTGDFSDAKSNPKPALILLDIGLPKISGIEFLKQFKATDKNSFIPVVILTAMESSANLKDAILYNCNSCLIKPFGYDETKELMGSAARFWGRYNRLPSEIKP